MAKLRDMTVNVVPKLDMRKAQDMSKKLSSLMKNVGGGVKRAASFGGKAVTAMNQGLQLLQQIKGLVAKTRQEVEGLLGVGDKYADIASAAGTSVERAIGLAVGLSGGVEFERDKNGNPIAIKNIGGAASLDTTMNMFLQFARRLEENGIQTDDTASAMVAVLKQINATSGQANKNAIAQKYFGARSTLDIQDLLAGVQDWEKNVLTAQDAAFFAKAARYNESNASRADTARGVGDLLAMSASYEKDLATGLINALVTEQNARTSTLKTATSSSIEASSAIVTSIESSIDKLINTLIGVGADIVMAVTDPKGFAIKKAKEAIGMSK